MFQIAEQPQEKIVYFPSNTKVMSIKNALMSTTTPTGAQPRWTVKETMCWARANMATVTPCVQAIL